MALTRNTLVRTGTSIETKPRLDYSAVSSYLICFDIPESIDLIALRTMKLEESFSISSFIQIFYFFTVGSTVCYGYRPSLCYDSASLFEPVLNRCFSLQLRFFSALYTT